VGKYGIGSLRQLVSLVVLYYASLAIFVIVVLGLRMGAKKSVVGLVVPTGYSFNLDAFSIYLTLAVVFIAHDLRQHRVGRSRCQYDGEFLAHIGEELKDADPRRGSCVRPSPSPYLLLEALLGGGICRPERRMLLSLSITS
jgi:hypothetical protein